MSAPTKPCPVCGEQILAAARKCRYCGEYLDPSARPRDTPDAVDRMVLPVGRATSAIVAGYLGLFACFPYIGLVAGILAVVFGLKALKEIKRDPSLLGNGRAWFGIVVGAPMILINAALIVVLIVRLAQDRR